MLRGMPSHHYDYSHYLAHLETIARPPWHPEPLPPVALARVEAALEREHSGLEKPKRRIQEYLAVRALGMLDEDMPDEDADEDEDGDEDDVGSAAWERWTNRRDAAITALVFSARAAGVLGARQEHRRRLARSRARRARPARGRWALESQDASTICWAMKQRLERCHDPELDPPPRDLAHSFYADERLRAAIGTNVVLHELLLP